MFAGIVAVVNSNDTSYVLLAIAVVGVLFVTGVIFSVVTREKKGEAK